jgi:hypothetical protein
MSEMMLWAQSNWYETGILVIATAFLVTGVWFAKNVLRTFRAFQEQLGALVKLSITNSPAEAHATTVRAKSLLAETSPYWLTPSQTQPASEPENIQDNGPGRLVVAWRGLIAWLQVPMSSSEPGPLRRVMHWLQEPARN